MSLYAVSDLHITGSDDPLYRSLLSLIRDRVGGGDVLVLVGDVFDLFVGNKRVFRERYSEFLNELRSAGERGARIHYIEGNHDFLIRGAFAGIRGLETHTDEISVEMGGKRFLFAHGDLADRRDYSYRFLRGFFRSPVLRAFVRLAPGSWIDGIGRWSSRRSSSSRGDQPSRVPVSGLVELRKIYRNYAAERIAEGYDYVVMGHCHDLDEMGFSVGGRPGQYINVGFPRVHGSYLSWSIGEEKISRERMP